MPEQYIDKENLQRVRDKLWLLSKTKRITLEDIQDRTGFSYSQVYRIVRGTNNMSLSGLLAVITALEAQPSDVFDFNTIIPKYPPLRKQLKS